MMRRLLLALLVLIAATGSSRAGGVLAESFVSPVLGHDWHYTIYLPENYQTSTQRYPVVYLLHGASQDESAWVRDGAIDAMADKLITRGDIPPCIVVMPAGFMSWYTDSDEKVETAIIQDLIPEIESRYRTKTSRNGRVVAGFSMGGYGAMRLALRHPEKFSAAALLSPAIYTPEPPANSAARKVPAFRTNGAFDPARWASMNWPALIDDFAAKRLPVRMHISAGQQDYFYADVAAQGFYTAWRERGWPAELHVEAGTHDFPFWRRLAPSAFRYLLNPPGPMVAVNNR